MGLLQRLNQLLHHMKYLEEGTHYVPNTHSLFLFFVVASLEDGLPTHIHYSFHYYSLQETFVCHVYIF